jgi:hypothetical protein
MMKYKKLMLFLMVVAAITLPVAAKADTILLNSDLLNEGNNLTGSNVQIAYPHPEWMPNGSDYFWISYQDTGYPPFPDSQDTWPENDFDNPAAIFYESFFLPYEINTGRMTLWADDTASVYLGSMNAGGSGYDYELLQTASFHQTQYCTEGGIGCIPEAGVTLDLAALGLVSGNYQFRMDVYQLGSGPFGLMYSGSMDSTQPVPEPSTLLLLSTGLGAIGLIWRRKK